MNNTHSQYVFLSENIKRIRNELGIPQERFALEAGIDRTLISKIERGLANPTLGVLIKISTRLNVSICELLCEPHNA
jgi:transcriptional regulator with XRE-family HTH domain